MLCQAALTRGGLTLRGRWTSQLHRSAGTDERLPAGVQIVLHHLGEAQRAGHPWSRLTYSAPSSCLPHSLRHPPPFSDQLVALVPVSLIDLHERVRLAEQVLETWGKGP